MLIVRDRSRGGKAVSWGTRRLSASEHNRAVQQSQFGQSSDGGFIHVCPSGASSVRSGTQSVTPEPASCR
jgi:hypothetical protein